MDWTRGHTLGCGSSAAVSLGRSLISGDVFAVKSMELSRSETLQKEERILSCLKSPYVVGYRGSDITRENGKVLYNLFMEYVPGGTLSDEIRRSGGSIHESMIGFYVSQIVEGLEYIHSKGLVHCDIKCQNILIGGDDVKIADFGCAKWGSPPAGPERIAGTPLFMAPEVARGEDQGWSSDVWALGCTIIEMATGGAPWPKVAGPVAALYRIGFSDELPWIPDFLSDQAKDFLGKCLRRDPKQRWTASQLLKHPFVGELSSVPKRVQESNSNSPTSILDQNFWSSLEESETEELLKPTSFSNSPAGRIRKLSMVSMVGNWRWDDSWLTVRDGINEENNAAIGDSQEESNTSSGPATASVSHDVEDGENHVVSEMVDFLDSNFSSNLLRVCKFMRDSVEVSNFNFESDKEILLITSTSISSLL